MRLTVEEALRYAGQYPAYFWHLPAEEALAVLLAAKDREIDEKLFLRWAIAAQHEMSFEEFKARLQPPPILSTKAILREVNEIINIFNKSGLQRIEVLDGAL